MSSIVVVVETCPAGISMMPVFFAFTQLVNRYYSLFKNSFIFWLGLLKPYFLWASKRFKSYLNHFSAQTRARFLHFAAMPDQRCLYFYGSLLLVADLFKKGRV